MILEGCQGKPRTPEILEKVCPQCGSEIELFTCDTQAVCEHCGLVVQICPPVRGRRNV